ncbi:MAG: SufD family Fe-S cluster assembly protein [Candidatus Brockarchaeota archaeon]|nr:SufD family Fe-S cluster assembly protein [Candidatus Brockarchaeota archaeon]
MNLEETRKILKPRAEDALKKPAPYGLDLDLSVFKLETGFGAGIEGSERILESVGIDLMERNRSGSYYQVDNRVVYSSAKRSGLTVKPLSEALEDSENLYYYWKAIPVDTDKYTAAAFLGEKEGYFIKVDEGVNVDTPVQACLLLRTPGLIQAPHNIVIVGENSKLHVITGCAAMREEAGLHIGISEFYVKKGGTLTFTMIHSWGKAIHVRPRTVAHIEEGGVFISHYINTSPVSSLQTYPVANLKGKESRAHLLSIIMGRESSQIDIGSVLELSAPSSSGEILSRTIGLDNSVTVARARIVGNAPGVKGHVECKGLLLSNESRIDAVPELEARMQDVQLTHEAAIGRIAEEELIYLMARGFSEEEAKSIIVRGFLSVELTGLPENLAKYLENILDSLAALIKF